MLTSSSSMCECAIVACGSQRSRLRKAAVDLFITDLATSTQRENRVEIPLLIAVLWGLSSQRNIS